MFCIAFCCSAYVLGETSLVSKSSSAAWAVIGHRLGAVINLFVMLFLETVSTELIVVDSTVLVFGSYVSVRFTLWMGNFESLLSQA